ncbi:MAG: HAD-IC family P-type ATPase, partial [Clostridiales bacterium]|nr:HAD-IC family P-type ATPase [Clostridiales bacterium]
MSTEYRSLKGILFHTLDEKEALEQLASVSEGISDEEAQKRTEFYGSNELKEGKKKTIAEMFLEQFKNVMIIVLIVAAAISAFTGELADALIILAVVIINAVLGVAQESKAEKALEALKSMSSPFAKVRRSGEIKQIKSAELVPGDIVSLEAGDYVPADLRLLHSSSLKIEEAALTGESVPVEKAVAAIDKPDIVIGDRKNMAFSGSSVTYGRGVGVVISTGMDTEVGKIAGHIAGQDSQMTPLQKKMSELSKFLTIGILAIAVVIFIAGVVQGREILDMSLVAISLAVAAIPEGLPAVITIVLALGVQKMAKKHAIIRKLSAVETLGSTEIICSDKTGTLTQNKMTVKEIYLNGRISAAEEVAARSAASAPYDTSLNLFMHTLVLCNDSSISGAASGKSGENGSGPVFVGDPTETALTAFALGKGFDKSILDKAIPRLEELPFDSDRKLMSSINELEEKLRVFTKGAPDVLLGRCSGIFEAGQILPMTEEHRAAIRKANSGMAGKALRVLGFAYKDLAAVPETLTTESLENDLVFIGLTGMIDPPRPEAAEAVRICSIAGIRPVMITGDHKDTAAAIAMELKIITSLDQVLTGSELAAMDDAYFEKNVDKYSVYARVSPEHKVKIVSAWKKRGKVVAMTGDGVNDAPALKFADIGVGMGITGTDVSKG